MKQSLEDLLTTARQQQDQSLQDDKTSEKSKAETKAFPATETADRDQDEKSATSFKASQATSKST